MLLLDLIPEQTASLFLGQILIVHVLGVSLHLADQRGLIVVCEGAAAHRAYHTVLMLCHSCILRGLVACAHNLFLCSCSSVYPLRWSNLEALMFLHSSRAVPPQYYLLRALPTTQV